MNPTWYVAKYAPDLERNEPTNIGLILATDEGCMWRFLGQQDGSASIDGRLVRNRFGSLDTYKAWFRHWTQLAAESHELVAEAARTQDPFENYRLELAGQMLIGQIEGTSDNYLSELFSRLVDEKPEPRTETIVSLANRVIRQAEGLLGDEIKRDQVVSVPNRDANDQLFFDYRYDNGRPHLMQRVNLALPGTASGWQQTHAASWAFSQAQTAINSADFIALVRTREGNGQIESQLRNLEQRAHVIDLDEPQAFQNLVESISH